MSVFMDLIKHIATLFGFVSSAYDDKVAREGLQECSKGIRRINKALKTATSLGEKQHLLASQRNIKTLRAQFKFLQKRGAGLKATKETAKHRVQWDDSASAFQSRIRTGVISNLKHKDTSNFLTDCKTLFRRRIQNALNGNEAIKVNTVFCGEFEKTSGNKTITDVKYFTTANSPIYKNTDINEWFNQKIAKTLLTEVEEFQDRDSGWTLIKIMNLGINVNKFTPQLGSSYIELPPQIERKKACINVRNNDDACFAWAVTSALYAVDKHPQRVSKYPHYSKVLKLKGIQFPMTLKHIPNFEKQNNISINVYILKNRGASRFETLPTYLAKKKLEKHVNLLLIQDSYDDKDEQNNITPVKYHFVWIKHLSRLLTKQLSKYKTRKYFCDRCLHYFSSNEKLTKHTEDCVNINTCKIRLPDDQNKFLKFKDFKNKEKAPFIIYADSECLLQPVQEKERNSNVYQQHVPYSMGYYIKCTYDDSLSRFAQYTGPDCTEWFTNELKNFAEDVETVFLCPLPMVKLTSKENLDYYKATICHICESPLVAGDKKVRDHCHLTGKYRGPAHEGCNINYKDSHTIPVVFHNLTSYDGSIIIEELAKEGRIDLLPVNKERYISFTKHIPESLVKFRFIDSYRFMASGLSTLASYLEDFPVLKSEYSDVEHDQLRLLMRKGVFPYDYMKSWETLNHTQLPDKKEFYNQLEDKTITDADYEHAKNVWKTFGCKTMQEYSDLYLKTDILLLADVFEQFRTSSFSTYGLDPAHYYTLPGYAWSCMFYKTGIQLELLTDIDMILFIERGIRGGLSQCSKRRAKANNKYMHNYDSTQDSKYLMYFDINNQYGWAMSQPLPTGDFSWLNNEEKEQFKLDSISDTGDSGYILEVDLEIPKELHDSLSDLPPCPQHLTPPGSKNRKLLATLYNKKKYIIHYRNLKQAVKLGVKISHVHRILKFRQVAWLKRYIDMNTNLRKAAKNEFEKNLFKLMNNAVFGKTMENIRNHSIVKLVNQWKGRYGAEALINKPQFKSATIFTDTLVAIELNKEEIYFNKPIYVGMCILDLAKTTIYDFHYGYMVPKFGKDCTICYTDTDSLLYEIKTDDVYQTIKEDCVTMFDTSDYPPDNLYDIPQVNKKVLGLMKDENNGMLLEEFVGLRSKMYAVRLHQTKEDKELCKNKGVTKKLKGIKKSVIKNKIRFEDYVECLDNAIEKTITQNLIRSEKHILHSVIQTKVALNHKDDKRFLIKGSLETLPWGHYSIME